MSSHSYNQDNPERTSDKPFWKLVLAVVGFIAAIAFACFMQGCSPVKRIGGLSAKHPDAALIVCNRMFPPKIDTVTRFDYIEGQTVTNYDTLTIDCDSVIEQSRLPGSTVRTKFVRVPCPGNTFRVDTLKIHTTITTFDEKQVKLLTKQNADLTADNARLKKGKKTATIAASALGLLLVAGFVLKLKKIV